MCMLFHFHSMTRCHISGFITNHHLKSRPMTLWGHLCHLTLFQTPNSMFKMTLKRQCASFGRRTTPVLSPHWNTNSGTQSKISKGRHILQVRKQMLKSEDGNHGIKAEACLMANIWRMPNLFLNSFRMVSPILWWQPWQPLTMVANVPSIFQDTRLFNYFWLWVSI